VRLGNHFTCRPGGGSIAPVHRRHVGGRSDQPYAAHGECELPKCPELFLSARRGLFDLEALDQFSEALCLGAQPSLLEAICSLPAAACSVTWLTFWIALLTSWALAACSTAAAAISDILLAVDSTPWIISFNAGPLSRRSDAILPRPVGSIP